MSNSFQSVKIMSTESNKNVNLNPNYVTEGELEEKLENYQPVGDYATQNEIDELNDKIIALDSIKFVEES